MRTLLHVVEYTSRSDVFRFYPSPDIHLGNAACDEKALAAWVKQIQDDPFALWAGIGDYAEFINRKDKRFDEQSLAKWLYGVGDIAKAQRERVIETLRPIADKCVALVKGNHEETIYRYTERDVYGPIVETMAQGKTDPLGLEYWGFVRLMFRRMKPKARLPEAWTLDLFLTHGWWGGALQGNGALNLERLGGWVQAQVVLAGHDHKLKTFAQTQVKPLKNGSVQKVRQVCGSCGAFLDGARYSEAKGYRPSPPGYLTVTIEPDKQEVRISQ